MSGGDVQAVVAQEQAAAFEEGEVVGFEEGHDCGLFYTWNEKATSCLFKTPPPPRGTGHISGLLRVGSLRECAKQVCFKYTYS